MPKKFCRVDQYLRIAIGLEFNELPNVTPDTPGVAEIRPYAGRNSQKVYLDLEHMGIYPEKFEIPVPEILWGAPWGEILLNNNRAGAQALFGREEEEMPFWPTEENRYVILRLYPHRDNPFGPVFVRIDKGPDTHFFVLRARWEDGVITVEIDRNPPHIPYCLIWGIHYG